jgi:hypothetical protein
LILSILIYRPRMAKGRDREALSIREGLVAKEPRDRGPEGHKSVPMMENPRMARFSWSRVEPVAQGKGGIPRLERLLQFE